MILRTAGIEDIDGIMGIEEKSFISGIKESRDTFIKRVETCPDLFYLLCDGDGNKDIIGYYCAELWDRIPLDRNCFALDHDVTSYNAADGCVLYISSVALDPSYRGRGLGKTLFNECTYKIVKSNSHIQDILLLVNKLWHNAVSIYEDFGFKKYGDIKDFFVTEGTSFTDALLYKADRKLILEAR